MTKLASAHRVPSRAARAPAGHRRGRARRDLTPAGWRVRFRAPRCEDRVVVVSRCRVRAAGATHHRLGRPGAGRGRGACPGWHLEHDPGGGEAPRASCADLDHDGIAGLTGAGIEFRATRSGDLYTATILPTDGEADERGRHPATVTLTGAGPDAHRGRDTDRPATVPLSEGRRFREPLRHKSDLITRIRSYQQLDRISASTARATTRRPACSQS